jgi:hypothetical protein
LYKKYKATFVQNEAVRVFESHKKLQWFQDLYDPTTRAAANARKKAAVTSRLAAFFALDDGRLDGVKLSSKENEGVAKRLMYSLNAILDPSSSSSSSSSHSTRAELKTEPDAKEDKSDRGGSRNFDGDKSDSGDSDAEAGVGEANPDKEEGEADIDELDFDEADGETTDPPDDGTGSKTSNASGVSAVDTTTATPTPAGGGLPTQERYISFELRAYPMKLPAASLEAGLNALPSFKRVAILNPTRTSERRAIVSFSPDGVSYAQHESNLKALAIPGFENALRFHPHNSRAPSARLPGDTVYRPHADDSKLLVELIELYAYSPLPLPPSLPLSLSLSHSLLLL